MLASVQRILGKYSLRPYRLGKRESQPWMYRREIKKLIAYKEKFVRKKVVSAPADVMSDTDKLSEMVEGAKHNLFVAGTVFPFVMTADTIKIDRQKMTIVHNQFFQPSQTTSIQLKDIMNIQAEAGPLFGNITITSKHFLNNTQTIKFLKRKDVYNIQKLIQGFMIAHRSNIETDNIDEKRLLPMLLELGEANTK